jgi:hypothetical protein
MFFWDTLILYFKINLTDGDSKMIELKDLSFIDKIALSILTSRLSSTDGLNLTRDKVESLATSAYRFATVVHSVREDFKKEHNILEIEVKELIVKETCCKKKAEAIPEESVLDDPFAEDDTIPYDQEILNTQTKQAKNVKKDFKKNKADPVEVKASEEAQTNGRKTKTVLKVNKILNRKN